jgi:glycogen synthase
VIKRVLMTADAVGGVWTYALDLAGELSRRGVEVALATMGPRPSDDQREAAGPIDGLRLYESDYKLEWQPDPWEDVQRASKWLLALDKSFQPDVVHLNGYCHGALPWSAPVLAVCHSCVLSWWRAVKGKDTSSEWHRYRDEVARGLATADVVVAPTRAMLDAAEFHYGPFRSSAVISNGRDGSLYGPGAKEPFILACGRIWDEGKNIGMLASVAKDLDWPVRIAGDGGNDVAGVEWLGRLTPRELAAQFAAGSIYVLPAKYEPFGLSVLEAALSGCALVLGDISSLRENWENAAVFVPPNDADSLREAICELTGDPDLRRSLSGKAQARAKEFSLEKFGNAYLEAYSQLEPTSGPREAMGSLA